MSPETTALLVDAAPPQGENVRLGVRPGPTQDDPICYGLNLSKLYLYRKQFLSRVKRRG
jgi:hypothetical protein